MRVVLACLAGFVCWTILWVGSNGALVAALPDLFDETGVTESGGVLVSALAVSAVCSLLAGYVAALVGRERSALAVRILAGLQLVIGAAVQASYWDVLPAWYNLAFVALLAPMHLLGGRLRGSESSRAGVVRTA